MQQPLNHARFVLPFGWLLSFERKNWYRPIPIRCLHHRKHQHNLY